MILYFSGTGNSKYVAERMAEDTQEEVLDLFQRIKNNDCSQLKSDKPWVIVVPTYAWRIPHIVEKWIESATFCGSNEFYFVMTCGGNIGNAGKYLKALCSKIGMKYMGCAEIVMPENYIAMFVTPTKIEAIEIIEKAEIKINQAIQCVKAGIAFPDQKITLADKISSGIVNDLFYPLFVHSKKFYATDNCVSCGLCERSCPLGNIKLSGGTPVWSDNCTHCMACICRCPKEAIEYGKHSKGLSRYTCPK